MPRKSSAPGKGPKSKDQQPGPQAEPLGSPVAAPVEASEAVAGGIGVVAEIVAPDPVEPLAEPEIAPLQAPAILIELDADISGGIVGDRFDILLRGRAVSSVPIEEVRLKIGERVFGAASYGQPERAIEARMPDGAAARQRGFQFNLSRPGLDASGLCRF